MNYCKLYRLLSLIFLLIITSCDNSKDEDEDNFTVSLEIHHFDTSYSLVEIEWKLERSDNVIVQDLLVYRTIVSDNEYTSPKLIANLPSNEISFTDNDVPYESDITYTVKINYRIDKKLSDGEYYETLVLEAKPQLFSRDLVKFNKVPLQVKKDPVYNSIFHILDKSGTSQLLKYNSNLNLLSTIGLFEESLYLNNVFHIINNEYLYVGNTKGEIIVVDINNYTIKDNYQLDIVDKLRSFSIDKDRIYYMDDHILHYFDMNTKTSINLGWGYFPSRYMETLSHNKTLFLGGGSYNTIVELSKDNCVDNRNCWPEILVQSESSAKNYHSDPFILAWNADRTKFISSYFGDVFDITNMSKKASLNEITGKRYFQFVFNDNGHIYASVQGEKLIQVFNSNYELVDSIQTKLYPLFPMPYSNGLHSIGSYNPVDYWGYYYGYEFNFNQRCAIETF